MKALLTEAHQRRILRKWAPILEAGPKIESDQTKLAMAQLLENTRAEFARKGILTEAGFTQPDMVGNSPLDGKNSKGVLKGGLGYKNRNAMGDNTDFYMPNIIMPMVRRIFPTLIANELVGVQPLNGPLGYAIAYRAKYGNNGLLNGDESNRLDLTDREIGFHPVDTRYTGLGGDPSRLDNLTGEAIENVVGDGATDSSNAADAWAAYAGKKGDFDGGQEAWAGTGAPLGQASEYASFSKGTYPKIGFGLIKTAVEAKTRKLGAEWSPELAEDMESMHGLDVEAEMINIISYEIGAEIDRQIITEMVKAAITGGSVSTWSPALADGLDQMGRLATLLTQITIEANQIALKTRRGNANFVVTSPRVTALLEQLSLNKFVSIQNTSKDAPSVPDSGVGAITKCGLINDGQQLLVRDAYASGDYVLMGYKGSHPADAGIIYCPYIPLQLSKALNPDTMTPVVGARTRYGLMQNVWDSRNYFHFITIAGLTAKYTFGGDRNFIQPFSTVKNGTLFV